MVGEIRARAKEAGLATTLRTIFALPDKTLRRLFGEPPEVARGLRADSWALCRISEIFDRGASGQTLDELRAETEMLARAVSLKELPPVSSEDRNLGGAAGPLPARLYTPRRSGARGPLLVWFHGGGWTQGSLESHDRSLTYLSGNSGIRILSVDYRLAPEHPFPAAADDALRAWRAVTADPAGFGAEPGRIAVGGDSSGGNLAAALCLDLKGTGEDQPLFQLLVYPVTEIRGTRQSYREFAEGFYLSAERMRWYFDQYAPLPAGRGPRLSPLLAEDLSGLAPAYVTTALADVLRDEGEDYARRLVEAGVETRLDRFPMVHAWFNMTVSRSSRAGHEVLAAWIRDAVARY